MAPKLKSIADWDALDAFRMETAVAEVNASESLRFLFRSILTACGATGTPYGDSPHSMAINVGRHSVGTEIMETLMAHQPTLCGNLLLEDAEEGLARDNLIASEDPDR